MQWVTQVATSNSDAGAALHRQQLAYFFLYVVHTNTRSVTMSCPSERYLTHIRVAFFVPPELFCMRAVQ